MGTRLSSVGLTLLLFSATPAIGQQAMSDRAQAAADETMLARTNLIVPGIDERRFAETSDGSTLWFDVVFIGRHLTKTAIEVAGDLLFYDLSGRARTGVSVSLQQPISRSDVVAQTGIGFAYDASRPEHQWLRSTPLSSMGVDFRVKRILYDDGELIEY